MNVCAWVCVRVRECLYACACVLTCVYVCAVFVRACISVCVRACVSVHASMHVCMHVLSHSRCLLGKGEHSRFKTEGAIPCVRVASMSNRESEND